MPPGGKTPWPQESAAGGSHPEPPTPSEPAIGAPWTER